MPQIILNGERFDLKWTYETEVNETMDYLNENGKESKKRGTGQDEQKIDDLLFATGRCRYKSSIQQYIHFIFRTAGIASFTVSHILAVKSQKMACHLKIVLWKSCF